MAMHKFPIYTAMAYQTLVWLIMSLAATLLLGAVGGYSAAIGGLISLVSGAYFMARYFKHSGARAMELVVKNALIAEFVKLVLIGLSFALVFKLVKPLNPQSVFGGFLVVQVIGMIISARLNTLRRV
jgi:ATP synthase protein I